MGMADWSPIWTSAILAFRTSRMLAHSWLGPPPILGPEWSVGGCGMKWLVWREGWDRWKAVWLFMDAATKAHLESRGYTVQPFQQTPGA